MVSISHTQTSPNYTEWVSCAKFFAIFAVLLDHTSGILYTNPNIKYLSFYSVSLFILISGYLSYASNERNCLSYIDAVKKNCKKIISAYFFATMIYVIVSNLYFDLQTYINAIIHFNASPPFYYVLLYIQLMLINNLLYRSLISAKSVLQEIGLLVFLMFIAFLTTNYTNILFVYGGGGKLLGGTYIVIFYIGMLLKKHKIFECHRNSIVCFLGFVFSILWFIWWRILCCGYQPILDSLLPYGPGFNPPSLSISIFAVLTLFTIYSLSTIISWNKYGIASVKFISFMGNHTLYIFLYHKLWLDFILTKYVHIRYPFLNVLTYYMVMILGSIAIEYIIKLFIECFSCKTTNT